MKWRLSNFYMMSATSFRQAFAKFAVAKENDPELTPNDWSRLAKARIKCEITWRPSRVKLVMIGKDTKNRFFTKTSTCYSCYKKECWDRAVQVFYDEDEVVDVNTSLSDKPKMRLFRQLFKRGLGLASVALYSESQRNRRKQSQRRNWYWLDKILKNLRCIKKSELILKLT